MVREERIACYYESDNTTTLYQCKTGKWEKETQFISRYMEDCVRQFKTSMMFWCNIDRDGFGFVITRNDVTQMNPMSLDEMIAIKSNASSKDQKHEKYHIEETVIEKSTTEYLNDNEVAEKEMPRLAITRTKRFLFSHTPKTIAEELKQFVLGQDQLLNEVADFLYYHMMRLDNPELPPRPMLISGPSGSGKTEVWRAVQKLYGRFFKIKIVNGAKITQEGWKGDNKLLTFVTEEMTKGGILVVDEFDKLATPSYSAKGDNVSYALQSEFLKLLEGEESFFITRSDRSKVEVNSQQMGFVLIGAFESLTQKRKESSIGFGTQKGTAIEYLVPSDEDYIDFGVMPELIGRVAQKCTTRELTTNDYLSIVKGEHSRVQKLIRVLDAYGIAVPQLMDDDSIVQLIQISKTNRTGVRWVSSQLEKNILEALRENGIHQSETPDDEDPFYL